MGKTIVLSEIGKRIGGRQLVLQHRQELVAQNLAKYRKVNPDSRPSLYTADTKSMNQDDPTIRRVRGFSELWGFGGFTVVNLFAEIQTNPAMGGIEAAYSLIHKALSAGKHVVTANKALLAARGPELFALAAQKGLGLYYEASCAGAVPIVETLKQSLAGNRIRSIIGILNGTANYILSQMSDKGLPFAQALAQAQGKGYAEADPTLDIEGMCSRDEDVDVEGLARTVHMDTFLERDINAGFSGGEIKRSELLQLMAWLSGSMMLPRKYGQARQTSGRPGWMPQPSL